mmetsp:Transcript_32466/g.98108  ORF Transcript_32466/g.98108 Transcript_32466/m.98108 type:complete len:232 (-) Transcript_32466:2777-3472(-)
MRATCVHGLLALPAPIGLQRTPHVPVAIRARDPALAVLVGLALVATLDFQALFLLWGEAREHVVGAIILEALRECGEETVVHAPQPVPVFVLVPIFFRVPRLSGLPLVRDVVTRRALHPARALAPPLVREARFAALRHAMLLVTAPLLQRLARLPLLAQALALWESLPVRGVHRGASVGEEIARDPRVVLGHALGTAFEAFLPETARHPAIGRCRLESADAHVCQVLVCVV